MKPIKNIAIKNYQSHASSELKLHPGVNVIVGSSDSGKSAIFRALNWVLTNQPLGTQFIRRGTKTCSVSIDIENDTITRKRGVDKNLYIHKDEELLAGRGVPEQLEQIYSIDPVINIQQQIGAPFLISSSPGDVASFFNEVAGLSEIDTATRNIKTKLKNNKQERDRYETNEFELSKTLSDYDYLPEAEEVFEEIANRQKELDNLLLKKIKIDSLLFRFDTVSQKAAPVMKKVKALPLINEQINKYEQACDLYRKMDRVQKSVRDYIEAEKVFTVRRVQGKVLPKIKVALNTLLTRNDIKKRLANLDGYIGIHKQLKFKQSERKRLHAALVTELEVLMPEECPLCGQEVIHEKN